MSLPAPANEYDAPSTDNQFERFTLHALESFLRSKKWSSLMLPFYMTNCPRFQSFNQVYSVSTKESVAEIDIQMHSVHVEFMNMVEAELFKEINGMGISEERFVALLDESLRTGDETVDRLYQELVVYRNFVDFGLMMQQKYRELYPPPTRKANNPKPEELTTNIRICRVLWDLENVQVSAALGGIKTVMQLQDFLKKQDLMGPGVDTRITAFFNPFNKHISKKVIEELNKASVELVCASSKREDADRKLGIRINQEMQLLNPALTTFVIISSDQDFRQHIQLLANAGYKVVIIHDARHESWRNTLEMHASLSFEWGQVVQVPPGLDEHSHEHVEQQPHGASETNSKEPSHAKQQNTIKDATAQPTTTNRVGRDPAKEALAVGWRVAVCQRWSSAFGFLLVDVSHPAVTENFVLSTPQELQQPHIRISKKTPNESGHVVNESAVRVYVHSSALTQKPLAGQMLRAGEYVLTFVEIDTKGPKATVVKDLFLTTP